MKRNRVGLLFVVGALSVMAAEAKRCADTERIETEIRHRTGCVDEISRRDGGSLPVDQIGFIKWHGLSLLPELREALWTAIPNAEGYRDYAVHFVSTSCSIFTLDSPSDLSRWLPTDLLVRPRNEMQDLAILAIAIYEKNRAMERQGVEPSGELVSYGCEILSEADGADLQARLDVVPNATFQVIENRIDIKLLCRYPDLDGSVWSITVVLGKDKVGVTTKRTKWKLQNGKWFQDDGIYSRE